MVNINKVTEILCPLYIFCHIIGAALLHEVTYGTIRVEFVNEIRLSALVLIINGKNARLPIPVQCIQV